jgi:hypothetical protein
MVKLSGIMKGSNCNLYKSGFRCRGSLTSLTYIKDLEMVYKDLFFGINHLGWVHIFFRNVTLFSSIFRIQFYFRALLAS